MPKAKLYDPASSAPFALSRSKVELFLDCPRCFYLDRRLGVARPSGPCQGQSNFPQLCKLNFPHLVQESVVSSARTKPAFSFSFKR